MSNVLPLSRYRPSLAAPLVIFVNLQKEFLFEGRPLQIKGANAALANCRSLLKFARAERLSIAHVRLADWAFHHANHGAEWIEDFQPYGSEMIFERDAPSCYSSNEFSRMMDQSGSAASLLVGHRSPRGRRRRHAQFCRPRGRGDQTGGRQSVSGSGRKAPPRAGGLRPGRPFSTPRHETGYAGVALNWYLLPT